MDFYCLLVLDVLLDQHLRAMLGCLLGHLDPKNFVAFPLLLKLFLQWLKQLFLAAHCGKIWLTDKWEKISAGGWRATIHRAWRPEILLIGFVLESLVKAHPILGDDSIHAAVWVLSRPCHLDHRHNVVRVKGFRIFYHTQGWMASLMAELAIAALGFLVSVFLQQFCFLHLLLWRFSRNNSGDVAINELSVCKLRRQKFLASMWN